MWLWEDFSSDSGVEDTPLLISIRTQSLAISALRQMQFSNTWDDTSAWDDIDSALSSALTELMSIQMPDFSPVGLITAWYTDTFPAKWLRCDGSAFSSDDYPELAAILGAAVLPDFTDRFLFGSGVNDDVGDIGGENYHILTAAEMPVHSHVVPAHSHTFGTSSGQGGRLDRVQRGDPTSLNTQATDTAPATDTSDTGGSVAHNNMPEYRAVHWIIKALP
jgi:microcystin-dependent protein